MSQFTEFLWVVLFPQISCSYLTSGTDSRWRLRLSGETFTPTCLTWSTVSNASDFPDEQLTTNLLVRLQIVALCCLLWCQERSNSFVSVLPLHKIIPQTEQNYPHNPFSSVNNQAFLTSEMLEIVSIWTSVELMISGEVVSRISTAMESRRRALKDTPSPSPSFRSWCSSIRVYCRVEPYMLTQAGPRVGKNPGDDKEKRKVCKRWHSNPQLFFNIWQ